MWGRREHTTPATATKEAEVAGRPRALSTLDELLRRAEWERLSDTDRAAFLSLLQAKFIPALKSDSTQGVRAADDVAMQDWIAGIVGPQFQADVAANIHAWLSGSAPDAHLFIG